MTQVAAANVKTMAGLEEEIATIRSQIKDLTRSRRLARSSLLQHTGVQAHLQALNEAPGSSNPEYPADLDPLSTNPRPRQTKPDPTALQAIQETQKTNIHRLAFTVTTFPFTDPSPKSTADPLHGRLLGIRFDHVSRLGAFDPPLYILLRRVGPGPEEWRVHRHTIPAFIPLARLQEEFMPLSHDEDADELNGGARGEGELGLKAFTMRVRADLAAWKARCEAIESIRVQLGLSKEGKKKEQDNEGDGDEVPDADSDEDEDEDTEMANAETPNPMYGITIVEPTGFDARFARICWSDDTMARIKISDKGLIEKAVVIGDHGRNRGVENKLIDGESRIEELVQKLKVLVGEA